MSHAKYGRILSAVTGVILLLGGGCNATDAVTDGSSTGEISTSCTGTLEEVNRLSAQPCPATYCDAVIQGSCDALKSPVTRSETCGAFGTANVSYSIGTKQHQVCYYTVNNLRGVTLSSDSPSYCNKSSKNMVGGEVTTCADPTTVLCDKAANSGAGGSGQTGTTPIPPAKCFNRFSYTCMPCCDPTPPDCANLPDGYPGYSCSQPPVAAGGAGSMVGYGKDFCVCRCSGGQWGCGC